MVCVSGIYVVVGGGGDGGICQFVSSVTSLFILYDVNMKRLCSARQGENHGNGDHFELFFPKPNEIFKC